ncbi:hypothetical protein [Enterovibrio sp. 27052020O]|uniref:hypothetical protein n=1 Tax=Enterovibrio sp. 27052020O TaxID=3241166 RepID=UPI00388FBC46
MHQSGNATLTRGKAAENTQLRGKVGLPFSTGLFLKRPYQALFRPSSGGQAITAVIAA